jgi:hypothetical protein
MLGRIARKFLAATGLQAPRINRALDYLNGDHHFRKSIDRIGAVDKAAQIQLMLAYQRLAREGAGLPALEDTELRVYSQNGEDGILLYLFALLGFTDRRCLELCAGDGVSCNSANLIINHGFHGALFDGNEKAIASGERFYKRCRDTRLFPPLLCKAWITRDNVNDLVRQAGLEGPIDFFSLDMDGVDYWIWEALEVVQPRVVVVEFNNLWPGDACVTVPYREDFAAQYHATGCDYAGASLGAFVKLAARKGYRLVGAQRYGFNAFFVREGLADPLLPAVPPETCVRHPFARHAREVRWERVRDLPWQEV